MQNEGFNLRAAFEILEETSMEIRQMIVKMVLSGGGGHIGGALSAADIATCLFFHTMRISPKKPNDPSRDRFILSGGHKSMLLYACLAKRGYFDEELLETYLKKDTAFGGHPDMRKIPGVDASTGSLGHGLPIGVGMAIAGKHSNADYRVFVIMGDGELGEGAVWEAAMAAHNFKLDNIVAVIDRNMLQIGGPTEKLMSLEPLEDKWRSFGWHTKVINGHKMEEIAGAFDSLPAKDGTPTVIIANTVKGKGVSFLENQTGSHYRSLTKAEGEIALYELANCGREAPANGR
jgi:transketolase